MERETGLRQRVWRNICSLHLFWVSLFTLCSLLFVASLLGFALVEWNLNRPGFAVLVVNFSAVLFLLVAVGTILRLCARRDDQ